MKGVLGADGLGARGIEYKQDSSGTRTYYLYDGLGSVIATTTEMDNDGNLTVTPTPRTDVYGNPVTAETGSNHRFCGGLGHTTDTDTGLIYMRARYYDPTVGRFASEDTAKDGVNWYAYCGNDPVSLVDRSGKGPELAIPLIIAAVVLAGVLFLVAFYAFEAGYATISEANASRGDPRPHPMTTGEWALSGTITTMVCELAGILAIAATVAGNPLAIPIAIIIVAVYAYALGAVYAGYNSDEPNSTKSAAVYEDRGGEKCRTPLLLGVLARACC